MKKRLHLSSFVVLLFALGCFAQTGPDIHSALIIIDMQPSFISRWGNADKPENKQKVEELLKVQIAAIREAKKQKIPIVFVEYEGKEPTNPVLTDEVKNYPRTATFKKTSDGMFADWNTHREELRSYLAKQSVNKLVITGANGSACVKDSIEESANDGTFHVVALANGIADFNSSSFIYPYEGRYTRVKPKDPDCKFGEVCTIEEALPNPLPACSSAAAGQAKRKALADVVQSIQRKPAEKKPKAVHK